MCGGGSAVPEEQTITTVNQLDPVEAAAKEDLFGAAQDLFENPTYAPYPGDRVADFAPQSLLAQQLGTSVALSPFAYQSVPISQDILQVANDAVAFYGSPEYTEFQSGVINANTYLTSPEFLDVNNNPVVQDYVDASLASMTDAFNRDVLPQIAADSVESGQFGSSRQGVVEANAANDLERNLLEFSTKAYSDAYAASLDAATKALIAAPGTAQIPGAAFTTQAQLLAGGQEANNAALQVVYGNIGMLDAIGKDIQMQDQREIDAAMQLHYETVNFPYDNVAFYSGVVNGTPLGGTQTQTAQNPVGQPDPLTQAIGGAVTGATIGATVAPVLFGSSMGSVTSLVMGGGWGAILGLAVSLFS